MKKFKLTLSTEDGEVVEQFDIAVATTNKEAGALYDEQEVDEVYTMKEIRAFDFRSPFSLEERVQAALNLHLFICEEK